jgi:hypothetical protein
MTMTEPTDSHALAPQDWLLAACRWLTSSPLAPAPVAQREALAPTPCTSEARSVDIAAEDWDLLFRAALELLERVAIERPVPNGSGGRLHAPYGTAFMECLGALDHLRRSVPPPCFWRSR